MVKSDKYRSAGSEAEVLPNLLGLTKLKEIEEAESRGVYNASLDTLNEVSSNTKFDLEYIYRIHRLAFEHLYPFAGKLREVNMSKGGFVFPAAIFLPETMRSFGEQILSQLPDVYTNTDKVLRDIAKVHAELLFIHPFREGNGRVARILTNAMAAKYGLPLFPFGKLSGKAPREKYIIAVQKAAGGDYGPMEAIFRMLLEDA